MKPAAPVAAPSLLPALCDPLSFLCPSRQALRYDVPRSGPHGLGGQIAIVNSVVEATPFFEALTRAAPGSVMLRFKPTEDFVELPESIARRAVDAARRGALAVIHVEDPTLSTTATIAKALLVERAQRIPLTNTLLYAAPSALHASPTASLSQLLALPLVFESTTESRGAAATFQDSDLAAITEQIPLLYAKRQAARAQHASHADALAVQRLVHGFLHSTLNARGVKKAHLHLRHPALFTAAVDVDRHRTPQRLAEAVLQALAKAPLPTPLFLHRLADPATPAALAAAAGGCRACRHAHPQHTALLLDDTVPTCRQCLAHAARALGGAPALAGSLFQTRQPKVAFMFLTRDNHKQPDIWQRFLAEGDGLYNVYCHAAEPDHVTQPFLKNGLIGEHITTYYGHVSLVRATIALLRAAVANPDNEKFVLVSESCVPLYGLPAIHEVLTRDDRGWLYDQGINASEMDERFKNAPFLPRESFHKQPQWLVFNRPMADVALTHDHTALFESVFAVDEVYFINVFIKAGLDLTSQTHNRLCTYDRFVVRKERDNAWVPRDIDAVNKEIIAEARVAGATVMPEDVPIDNPWYNCSKDPRPLFVRKVTTESTIDSDIIFRN